MISNAIMKTLAEAGYEAFLVGGCVRDLLLGREPADYDITTSAMPEETEMLFEGRELVPGEICRTVGIGKKHGTIGVIFRGVSYEVTTYRVDGAYTDNRHPDSVQFTRSLAEDLARRDFTVNALAMDRFGQIAEQAEARGILAQGLRDLQDGVLRAVGEADRRFDEDALRILRGVRFAAQLGFDVEETTADAIHRKKALLHHIAPERIRVELTKLLCAPAGERREPAAVRVLRAYRDVFAEVIPELAEGFDFDQQNPFHCYTVYEHELQALAAVIREENDEPDETVRLAALLHDVGKPACFVIRDGWGHFYGHEQRSAEMAEAILRRLRYDNRTVRDVTELIRAHGAVFNLNEKYARRKLNQLGEQQLLRLIRLERADVSAQAEAVRAERVARIGEFEQIVRAVLESLQCFSLRDMALSGEDLKELGIPEGPEIGRILRAVFDRVLAGELTNEQEVLIEEARKMR